jgi:thioredoxin-related protein
VFDATKNKFKNISFQQINIDEQQDLASKYGVRGIPHVIMLDAGGSEVYNGGAFGDEESFSNKINSLK